ncbi:acidic proline-rich protein HP43A-like [Bufo gargarizans]|uniref:acidic proline-rich protein HP43A-like n=1 Tax=Bufo gargarizans TaxID=30331 RepID=UPI001CF33499|nr:acidic proline-rich protein HP43A-like [Bufo gargarizans]
MGVEEESAEQAVEEQPGPSQQGNSSPPPPEEGDMQVYTPNQEGVPVPPVQQMGEEGELEMQPGPSTDRGGPSQPGDSSPPPPEEGDKEVYTPHQEVIRKLKRRLLEQRKTEAKSMQAIKAEKKK